MAGVVDVSEIELVAFDVDGTLVPSGSEVSERNRDAIARAQTAGIHVAIATGRRYRTTRRVVDSIGRDLPLVVLGGALVKDDRGMTLHRETFAPEEVRSIVSLFRELGQMAVAQRDAELHEAADFVFDGRGHWNPYSRNYRETNVEVSRIDDDLMEAAPDDVVVLGTFTDAEHVEPIEKAVLERFGGRFSMHGLPSPGDTGGWYCEIAPAGVSKWTGLLRLASHLGLDPSRICAVGDEVNDLPMLEGAGYAVAMGNARPHVQAVADWVTERVDADGVAHWIDRLLSMR